jgi:shikimate dehydrogenase
VVPRRPDSTIVVGLIGSGIGGSFSPALHEREAGRLGLDYEYRLLDLEELGRAPEEVGTLVAEARDDGLRGLNVTHPCKQLVVPGLDALSPGAAALRAVNTVVFAGGRAVGHNTDEAGFREAFARRLAGAPLGRVVVLGAGGAGAAVTHAILGLGAGTVTVLDREPGRAEALAAGMAGRFPAAQVGAASVTGLRDELARADGVVHATPTGMAAHPGSAIPLEWLEPRHWVADIVYMPVETQLLAEARARGCRTMGGSAMVALQAAEALALLTGTRPNAERMLAHADELFAEAALPA